MSDDFDFGGLLDGLGEIAFIGGFVKDVAKETGLWDWAGDKISSFIGETKKKPNNLKIHKKEIERIDAYLEKHAISVTADEFINYSKIPNYDVLRILLIKGIKIKARDKDNSSIMKVAIDKCDIGLADFAFKADFKEHDTIFNDFDEVPLLTYAVIKGKIEFIDYLLSKNFDINDRNGYSENPLLLALINNDMYMAEYLISKGADIDYKHSSSSADGFTSLMLAVYEDKYVNIFNNLLALGADINEVEKDGHTALTLACIRNKEDMVYELVKSGANVNHALLSGVTPLMIAGKSGNEKITESLISHNANVDQKCDRGNSALTLACKFNKNRILNMLIQAEANVNCKDPEGCTPLIIGCENQNVSILDILLKHGANVHERDNAGRAPIIVGCEKGNITIVELLIKSKANVREKTPDKRTPLKIAKKSGNIELKKLLIKNGARNYIKIIFLSGIPVLILSGVALFWKYKIIQFLGM